MHILFALCMVAVEQHWGGGSLSVHRRGILSEVSNIDELTDSFVATDFAIWTSTVFSEVLIILLISFRITSLSRYEDTVSATRDL